MLSIIVSSYQKDNFYNFSKNIRETIGVGFSYEIIAIENPGLMGICEAYNKGAEKSLYSNLLFIHEDVLFTTQNWGEVLIRHLNELNCGCVGVAGNAIKTRFPIAWWDIKESKYTHIVQSTKSGTLIKKRLATNNNDAVLLDGVFIGVKKEVWNKIKFNEGLLKNFHGYDIDFSIRVSRYYNNYIINDIHLTHFSEGTPNKKWFEELTKVYQYNKGFINKSQIKLDDIKHIELYFRYLRAYNFTKKNRIRLFLKFYNPLRYSLIDNYRILKMLHFYTFK